MVFARSIRIITYSYRSFGREEFLGSTFEEGEPREIIRKGKENFDLRQERMGRVEKGIIFH